MATIAESGSLRPTRVTRRVGFAAALSLALLATGVAVHAAVAAATETAKSDSTNDAKAKARPAPRKSGLMVNDPKACAGYTLLASANSTMTYLIDMQGHVVRSWKSDCNPGLSAYLLENGNLLRTGQVRNPPFFGGGAGGRIQEFAWDGKIVWDFTYCTPNQLPNHDVCRLPNGHLLMNVWERKSPAEAIAAGRRPETVDRNQLLSACILEVEPTGKTTGKVVWEWHVWDHLIQDYKADKANHGDVSAHPELIDVNFGDSTLAATLAKPDGLEKLRSIGYVGGPGKGPQRPQPDWLHVNSVAYNAELDQILLSVYEFNEIWIIDHSTAPAQAAGHQGGRQGKGGDLLYRWGNPRAYRAGTIKDQQLFGQHDAQWIGKGLPGEGHVLIFNNGMRRTGGAYSTVDEIVLPVDATGRYDRAAGKPSGPDRPVWTYAARKTTDFYAPFISGAQRLPNGDTLICSGTNGTVFEVTPKNEIVWKYVNPTKNVFPFGGPPGFGGPPKLGRILPPFLQGFMSFSPEQKNRLEAAENEIGEKLTKTLTAEQKKQFETRPRGFAPGDLPLPGQLMAAAVADRLKLTADQKRQLAGLQKEADGKLDAILKTEQKKQLKQMQDMARRFAGGGPGRFPGGPPAGPPGGPPGGAPGGPRGGPPGGFPGFGGFGPPGGSGLFRAPATRPSTPG